MRKPVTEYTVGEVLTGLLVALLWLAIALCAIGGAVVLVQALR